MRRMRTSFVASQEGRSLWVSPIRISKAYVFVRPDPNPDPNQARSSDRVIGLSRKNFVSKHKREFLSRRIFLHDQDRILVIKLHKHRAQNNLSRQRGPMISRGAVYKTRFLSRKTDRQARADDPMPFFAYRACASSSGARSERASVADQCRRSPPKLPPPPPSRTMERCIEEEVRDQLITS